MTATEFLISIFLSNIRGIMITLEKVDFPTLMQICVCWQKYMKTKTVSPSHIVANANAPCWRSSSLRQALRNIKKPPLVACERG